MQTLSSTKKAYIAGFLDADGSIYVRAKPNSDYRYGFQIAPYIVFFQSAKERQKFEEVCSLIGYGRMRERKDGILEYAINRIDEIKEFLNCVHPFVVIKKKQAELMLEIIDKKSRVKNEKNFEYLLKLVDSYRELNYSKRRKRHRLTP